MVYNYKTTAFYEVNFLSQQGDKPIFELFKGSKEPEKPIFEGFVPTGMHDYQWVQVKSLKEITVQHVIESQV